MKLTRHWPIFLATFVVFLCLVFSVYQLFRPMRMEEITGEWSQEELLKAQKTDLPPIYSGGIEQVESNWRDPRLKSTYKASSSIPSADFGLSYPENQVEWNRQGQVVEGRPLKIIGIGFQANDNQPIRWLIKPDSVETRFFGHSGNGDNLVIFFEPTQNAYISGFNLIAPKGQKFNGHGTS